MMNLQQKIINIVGKTQTFNLRKINNGLIITIGNMYKSPDLSFAKLLELSKLFGTTEIDVDNYSSTGCESCDWGSDYGHEISIGNPTKHLEEIGNL